MKTALILIDIQNDYFEGGKSELYQSENAMQNAEKILQLFRQHKLPIFHVQHINTFENAPFFSQNSYGAEIYDKVKPLAETNEKLIIKHVPNAFFDTSLKVDLVDKGIEHIVICGMMTHMCIDTTVRAAKDLGFIVTLLNDACTTKDLEINDEVIPAQIAHKAFMASLNGVFANVQMTDDFLNSFVL